VTLNTGGRWTIAPTQWKWKPFRRLGEWTAAATTGGASRPFALAEKQASGEATIDDLEHRQHYNCVDRGGRSILIDGRDGQVATVDTNYMSGCLLYRFDAPDGLPLVVPVLFWYLRGDPVVRVSLAAGSGT
jgi:hypothetical protein